MRRHSIKSYVCTFLGDHGDGQPFDGAGGELAHASASEKKIHFDDDEDWLYYQVHSADFRRTGKMPDFVQTIIHEMGHVLGLSHTKTKESVMFPTIYTGPAGSHYALHQEDISRVQAIYGMLLLSTYLLLFFILYFDIN